MGANADADADATEEKLPEETMTEQGEDGSSPEDASVTPLPPPPPEPNAFGRMVIKFSGENKAFMLKLHRVVGEINAKALLEDLNEMPEHVVGLALAARSISEDERNAKDIDFVSGERERERESERERERERARRRERMSKYD